MVVQCKALVFFDRDMVRDRLDSLTYSALFQLCALTRRIAQNSMKTTRYGVASRPGNPPHSHGRGLLKLVLFGYDPATRQFVVGPVYTGSRQREGRTVPEMHEYGRAGYPPRPFMRPALAKAVSHDNIRDAFRKANRANLLSAVTTT